MIRFFPISTQIAKFMGPTWSPPGSCRPQMGPMSAPWILLLGNSRANHVVIRVFSLRILTPATIPKSPCLHRRTLFSESYGHLPAYVGWPYGVLDIVVQPCSCLSAVWFLGIQVTSWLPYGDLAILRIIGLLMKSLWWPHGPIVATMSNLISRIVRMPCSRRNICNDYYRSPQDRTSFEDQTVLHRSV